MRKQPIRWFDVNHVGADVMADMVKGVSLDYIPLMPSGGAVCGEIVRHDDDERCPYCNLRVVGRQVRCTGCGAPC